MSSPAPVAKAAAYFGGVQPIKFEGLKSDNPLAFRYYNKDQMVLGKRMEEQLRPAVCYWHSFAWNGHDIFGQGDHVVSRVSMTATNTGGLPWFGIPANGNRIEDVEWITIFRLQDGKVVETWAQMEVPKLMTQLGAMAGPGGE